jgi:hypothetical protein
MPDRIVDISEIRLDPDNANLGTEAGEFMLISAIRQRGMGRGVFLDADLTAIAGNQVLKAAAKAGIKKVRLVEAAADEIVATVRPDVRLDSAQGRQMALDDNGISRHSQNLDVEIIERHAADYDLDLDGAGITEEVLAAFKKAADDGAGEGGDAADDAMDAAEGMGEGDLEDAGTATAPPAGGLAAGWVWPPFTLWDGRAPAWLDRKRQWMALGLRPDGGARGFDPVAAELIYRWFCPRAGLVVDVSPGDATRAVVALKLGCHYVGVDPDHPQIQANREDCQRVLGEGAHPTFIRANPASGVLTDRALFGHPDLIVATAPDPGRGDRSTFLAGWQSLCGQMVELVKPQRFIVVIVRPGRQADGEMWDMAAQTQYAMGMGGAKCWNEAVYCAPAAHGGPNPVEVGAKFQNGRRLAATHANVLVFFKGDPRRMAEDFPQQVEAADLTTAPNEV